MLPVKNIEIYSAENIVNLEDAFNIIKQSKANGKKVGLCHGRFDLLHPGHIKHFESAKNLCDILFVSFTADSFVKIWRGPNRPIFNEKLRAYMIANIRCVDYALIATYPTGVEMINKLAPSVYIKGVDCILEDSPQLNAERKAIKDVGGEIRYTQDIPLSTTGIIEYIKNNF
jgi:rfaE bifunctional protein nucleotidyltransferase chain/domain